MKILIRDCRQLLVSLRAVTSGSHTVVTKLANGDASSAQVPYELDDKARWNLIKNLDLAERLVKHADLMPIAIGKEIEAKNGGKVVSRKENPSLFAEYSQRVAAIEDREESAPFLRVKRTGLRESNDNPIPGMVITGLLPILSDDLPAAAAEDIIPDEPAADKKGGAKK